MKIPWYFRQKLAVALVAGLGGMFTAIHLTCAQPLQPDVLFNFTGGGPAYPSGTLVQGKDGNFYGTTQGGGIYGGGTVFRVTANGTITDLYDFPSFPGYAGFGFFSYSFGSSPSGLTMGNDGNLYGTTEYGPITDSYGDPGPGTVFQITPDGQLTTLVTFGGTNGASPVYGLTLGSDGNFYGTTTDIGVATGGGGSAGPGGGRVFRVTTNGVLTTLVVFDGTNGGDPEGGLTLGSDGNFYGTTRDGGITNFANPGYGTVFRVTTNGALTTLVSFDGANGANPQAGLMLGSDGKFYGTTSGGGNSNAGTVFQVTTNGVLTTVLTFTGPNGASPAAALALGNNGNFYGTTSGGGSDGWGTMFQVTPSGLLTTLVSLAGTNGAYPNGLMLGSDGNFYGTTSGGGDSGDGTVFQLTPEGVLTTLAAFSIAPNGLFPNAGLTPGSDGNLYGTTSGGGNFDDGTVFQLTTNGVLTTLVSFAGTNGAGPNGMTLGSDGNFYGTTYEGGPYGNGTVFRVTTDGVLTTLVSFNGAMGSPVGGLTLGRDGSFYGTTYGTGTYVNGTVFRVTTNGILTTLLYFAGTSFLGLSPLTLGSDGNFYGTTSYGGPYTAQFGEGLGTVFRVTTNGIPTRLVSFAGTNGAGPDAGLTLGSDGNFYGTTAGGGITNSTNPNGYGTVFQVTTNGVLTTLVSFDFTHGAYPEAGLTLGSDGNFYGATSEGGITNSTNPYGYGTVFQVTTNGVLTTLISFDGANGAGYSAALTLGGDGSFYGTTHSGGTGGAGVIYRLRRGASIQSFGMATNGFQINTLNVGGSGWVGLESSSDLAHWTRIQTNGTAAAQQFLDATALSQPRRFYRVRQE